MLRKIMAPVPPLNLAAQYQSQESVRHMQYPRYSYFPRVRIHNRRRMPPIGDTNEQMANPKGPDAGPIGYVPTKGIPEPQAHVNVAKGLRSVATRREFEDIAQCAQSGVPNRPS